MDGVECQLSVRLTTCLNRALSQASRPGASIYSRLQAGCYHTIDSIFKDRVNFKKLIDTIFLYSIIVEMLSIKLSFLKYQETKPPDHRRSCEENPRGQDFS